VRDGVEERAAELVGATQHLGFGGFLAESGAIDGEADLRGGGGEEAVLGAVEMVAWVGEEERADATVADLDRHEMYVVTAAAGSRGMDDAHPAARGGVPIAAAVGGRPAVQHARSGATCQGLDRGEIAGVEALDLVVGAPELDYQRGQLELAAQALRDPLQHLVEVGFAEKAHHVVEHHRFALALARFSGALALTGRQLARDGGDDQKKDERDPLVGVRHRELVHRLDEEPVEREERGE
jgi:hypothetical protein